MRIGPYEVLEPLGRGAAGAVYRCRSPEGGEVAVKVLLSAAGKDARARFAREVRLQGGFGDKDGFVSVVDAGEVPEGPYVVMPLLTGGTLRARLAHGPLDLDDARALGIALAKSMALAHERGIVHRDLKPENVLFSGDGRPLIADLGLAKHWSHDSTLSQSAGLSKTGELRGTPGYMAPEQANDSKRAGPPADVFALAAIMYETLAGQSPFEADGTLATIGRTVEGDFEPLRRLRPEVPAALAQTIERALSPDPARRPQDAGAFAREIASGRRAGSRRALVVALALLVLCGGALGAWLALRPGSEAPAVRRARCFAELDEAHKLELGGKGLLAEEHYRRACDIDPGCVEAWLDFGRSRAARGDDRSGLDALDEGIKAVEGKLAAKLWVQRAAIRWKMSDHAGALADFAKALEANPEEVDALWQRGAARDFLRDRKGALEDLDRAATLAPKSGRVHYERSIVRWNAGDKQGALADAIRACELEPKVAQRWKNLAEVRAELGDRPGRLEALTKAIEITPGDAGARVDRAEELIATGEIDAALVDLERALARNAKNVRALVLRSSARVEQKDFEKAIADADLAVALAPKDVKALRARATAHYLKGDYPSAVDDFSLAIEARPSEVIIYLERANARLKMDDRDDAIADLEKVLQLAPPDSPHATIARNKLDELRSE